MVHPVRRSREGKRTSWMSLASGERLWIAIAMCIALALFLSTVQTRINGARHAYTTDVGEIQNALPRWGLIHRSGYPLYTFLGSLFVSLLRPLGIPPAAGSSLYSTVWAVVSVGLLAALALELGASSPAAALAGLTGALSTSLWVNASLAEVHTLTIALSLATLLFAVRFGRTGERRPLLFLILSFTQGIAHQRSVIVLAPAVAILIWPHLQAVWSNLGLVFGLVLLAPLTYLYLPLRVWTGATWVFGSPATWSGFWAMLFDNRAERVIELSAGLQGWIERLMGTLGILADDLPWPLLIPGLAGLGVPVLEGRRRQSLALTIAWVPNLILAVAIWIGRVGDAQLAAKLPIVVLAAVGLGLALDLLGRRSRWLGLAATVGLAVSLGWWGFRVRPFVVSLTRDPSAEIVISAAAQVAPPRDGFPTTLAIPWGHDYWAVAYAQAYRGELPSLDLVDHNADMRAIVERGDRLLTTAEAFYTLPMGWWERRLGQVHLSAAAPGIVEISPTPAVSESDIPVDVDLDLLNGIRIRSASLRVQDGMKRLLVTVYWEALRPIEENYSVAVHLVAHDPPRDGSDVLRQADSLHPIAGWYPTSRWQMGEIVRDCYAIDVPPGSAPVGVRVALYRVDESGSIVNSTWLTLPTPTDLDR